MFFLAAQLVSIGQENLCDENSLLVTPCYVAGDPANPNSAFGMLDAVVAFPYSNSTTTRPIAPPDADRTKVVLATAAEVGAVWGIAHQRSNNLIFTSSVLKRHAGYGPLGSGGIYVIQVDENLGGGSVNTALSFRMDDLTLGNGSGTILTADPSLTTNAQRGLPLNGFTDSRDSDAFSGVGNTSLGDIDISEDESTLWVTNLYDRSLYEIPIGAPMESSPETAFKYPIPNTDLRPWALKVRAGKVYVGAVDPSAIEASVWVFDIDSKTWDSTPLITVDLVFDRGNLNDLITPGSSTSANWNDWANTWAEMDPPAPLRDESGNIVPSGSEFGHPQPILSDIEFAEDGKLVLGFLDRGGMQLGVRAISPDPNVEGFYSGDAAGDILVAQLNTAGQYILEENGALAPDSKDIGGEVPQNPGDAEFISGDFYARSNAPDGVIHEEVTIGGLAYLSSTNEVVSTAFDPLSVNDVPDIDAINTDDLEFEFEFSGGTSWFSLNDGTKQRAFMVFSRVDLEGITLSNIFFGKAAGLGDLELYCSAEVPVVACVSSAGSLSPVIDSVEACYDGNDCVEISAVISEEPSLDEGDEVLYVLTSTDSLVIQDTGAEPSFCVEGTGAFTIHTLVYDPMNVDLSGIVPGETKAQDVLALLAEADTCASLDVAGASFFIDSCAVEEVCITDAGSLAPRAFPDSVEGCYDGENCVELIADIVTEASLDTGYAIVYVLTATDSLVIQATGAEPVFCVEDTGKFTIHTLVYDSTKLDLSVVVPGETTGADVLDLISVSDTCAKLDVAGAMFNIEACTPPEPPVDTLCVTDAGSLTPRAFPDSVEGCYDGENCVELIADIATEATLDTGYAIVYVLTATDSLVIQATGAEPVFCVEDTGKFTIHTLVYDSTQLDLSVVVPGETTGADVLDLISVSDTCAKLDVAGAMFNIEACTPPDPPVDTLCVTDAGSLTPRAFPDSVEGCYDGENCVELIADIATEATLDTGYTIVYVLTATDSLVIQATGAEPVFCVEDTGKFTIHTLVYDSTQLDLSVVVPGETTGADVLDLISVSDSCAKLDVVGAMFNIEACTPPDPPVDTLCVTDAGSLTPRAFPDSVEGCYDGENCVELIADIATEATLDTGYTIVYVLTATDSLVIQATGAEPVFCVEDTGKFTIHTLVYDSTQLDLSVVVPGETTGADVLDLISVSDSCAKLDVAGAMFNIEACTPPEPPTDTCITDAGKLTPMAFPDSLGGCYDGVNCVELVAMIEAEAVLDSGYSLVYVLTSGESLVIQATGAEPTFCVEDTGKFTIHTLVYDSTKLDLSGIVVGETTGGDVLELIALSDTCAKLDVDGAMFEVEDCGACPRDARPQAGTLVADPDTCFDGENPVLISATVGEEPFVPDGYVVTYVLTQGDDLVLTSTGDEPSFSIGSAGRFTIHTLVYDTLTLDLSLFEPGVSTGGDVLAAIDTTCAALDVAGAMFNIDTCTVDPCIDVDISAGTLIGTLDSCYADAPVKIMAEHGEEPIIPEGYVSIYVLTQGSDLIVTAVDTVSMFLVEAPGTYRIHTFVFDSTDFDVDLSPIELGTTTAAEVLALQGDSICVALDVEGALFEIEPCVNNVCPDTLAISAGTLQAVSDSCYDGTTPIMIVAEHDMEPTLPEGYSSVYVLTQGEELLIVDTDSVPVFEVEGLGTFTIHTLVYDPTTLDLGVVNPGVTTAGDVLALLQDSICAALDVPGAPFDIIPCTVDSTCEDIKDYVLSSWGADRNANFDHSVFLFHSPADPDRMMLGDRDFQQYFWESTGTFRVFIDEMGEVKDTAIITGIVASEEDPSLRLEVDFVLVNPMTWEEHQAMGGSYKANLYSEATADTAHVNWTYWEISDASKLVGIGALEGLVFDVTHAPDDLRYKLQVGYGANDKDGSFGLSGWFGYTGEFDGVSYSAQGDINVDIDTCIVTEICEPVISASHGSWVIRDVSATAVYSGDPRVNIAWSAFSSNPDNTTYSIDRTEEGAGFYETIQTLRAASNTFRYTYTDQSVEGHKAYAYRVRVVMEGEPVTTTSDVRVSLDRVFFSVLPNPADKALHLAASNPHIGDYRLQLLNSHGQVIAVEQVQDLVQPYKLDVSKLSAGFYFLKVTTPEEGVHMLRFVKN